MQHDPAGEGRGPVAAELVVGELVAEGDLTQLDVAVPGGQLGGARAVAHLRFTVQQLKIRPPRPLPAGRG